MEPTYNISLEMLNSILEKLNALKVTRNQNKIYNVTEIVSVNTRRCGYASDKNNVENKTHLHIKFTSPDENGTICVSVLLNKYIDLFHS